MPATEEFWRSPRRMHVVFVVCCLIFLVSTIWMLYADYDDEWRVYQREFAQIDAERSLQLEGDIEDPAFKAKREELESQRKAARDELRNKDEEMEKLKGEIAVLETDHLGLSVRTKFKRAERDKARADYDLAVRDNKPEERRAELKEVFDAIGLQVEDLETGLQATTFELEAKQAQLAAMTKVRDDAEAAFNEHTKELKLIQENRLAKQPDSWSFASFKHTLVNTPLIDLNPTYKINQVWLPDLPINLGGMKDVPRFDRCITCHQATDRVAAGGVPEFPPDKYEHPFRTHPRTDLYMTAASPHPQAKFGCTICHDGQGSGTSFQNASHSPNNPVIDEEWKKEFGYYHNHFWEHPMFPDRFKESTCLKCHHDVVELGINPKFGASAPKAYKGWDLVAKYGCFGCHEIRGYDGTKPIGPDLRLEPSTPEQAAKIAEDPNAIAGTMRKVGPSLRSFASKVTSGWAEVWVEEPKKFRPETRMPQFFHLSNQQDDLAEKYNPVEVAGIVAYLMSHSEAYDALTPPEGYEPNAERGKKTFAVSGCLNCHKHVDFPGIAMDIGPDLSRVHEKLLPGKEGFQWLYTWVREPTRYHARTIMPNLFLEQSVVNGQMVDPAADIAAFLLQGGSHKFGSVEWSKTALDELVLLYLGKAITPNKATVALKDNKLPAEFTVETIKGDEVELLGDKITEDMKLNYVGRRTISRYGCYGCHDIPGFEEARPIGTALQDWGRKDPSKLAFEHIAEYLHHFGEKDGTSTAERAKLAIERGEDKKFSSSVDAEAELSVAYFYEQILHHGRPGFAWQKLRAPRSYDYRKIETKGFDERLRMPKFPFSEEENEAVVTFLLGLVGDPPPEQYVYTPTGPAKDRVEGEKLLRKYNCTGCHMVEMPEVYAYLDPENLLATNTEGEYQEALDLLLKLKPVHHGETGATKTYPATEDEDERVLPEISFRGMPTVLPDPEDDPADREYIYQLWQPLQVGEKLLLPGEPVAIPEAQLNIHSTTDGRGGEFAKFLLNYLQENDRQLQAADAWQMSPPPLYLEGIKVQTPWLYTFLKNPDRLRFLTVLRMPKFNMSDEEAQILANYFAAVDGARYPYQDIPEREPPYLDHMNAEHPGYLEEAWKLFTLPRPQGLCVKCHQFAGMKYSSTDPKDKRGPNLDRVSARLRPEWTLLWIFKPGWITPYTSMPQNFKKGEPQFPELFKGKGDEQTKALRDALMNYHRLMEKNEKPVAGQTATDQAGGE